MLKTNFQLISNNGLKHLNIDFITKAGMHVEYNRFFVEAKFFLKR